MPVEVKIPSTFRQYTDRKQTVELDGASLNQVLDALFERFPPLRDHIVTEEGEVRRFINIYINDEDIRFLDGLISPLTADSKIHIVPAIAGG